MWKTIIVDKMYLLLSTFTWLTKIWQFNFYISNLIFYIDIAFVKKLLVLIISIFDVDDQLCDVESVISYPFYVLDNQFSVYCKSDIALFILTLVDDVNCYKESISLSIFILTKSSCFIVLCFLNIKLFK